MRELRSQYAPVLEALRFLRLWIKRPQSIGAIAPSSNNLAAAIAREVDFSKPGVVVELGGGTGSITAALVENAADPKDIVVIEREASLCALLSKRFPDVHVICGDARKLKTLLEKAGLGPVKAVVSGLPLLSLSRRANYEIMQQSVAVLPPDGVFVQFTYGLTSPVPGALAARAGMIGNRSDWILQNIPPASVWLYRHKAASV